LKTDKQKDMAEDTAGIKIKMRVVDLGTDPATGRELTSLVVGDAFDAAQGREDIQVDLSEWTVAGQGTSGTEPWTGHVDGIKTNSKWQRRILQALADLAHSRGLTEAACRRAVEGHWGKVPDPATWTNAWNAVTSAPVAAAVGGERWALDQAILQEVKDRHGA
jgi:hypothetical protein